jgi:hypothetical protein
MKKVLLIILFFWIYGITSGGRGLQTKGEYHQVRARSNANNPNWTTYTAKTVDRLPGFRISKEPEINSFGSWKINRSKATGFFRVEKRGDRWWIIDPEGCPFIHKGVAVFRPGNSDNQVAALKAKFETNEKWAEQESLMLKQYGFNGAGSWSDADLLRQTSSPLVYTIIISPMGAYKSDHLKKFGGKYVTAGWQGYRYDLAMVFDPEFDAYVEKAIAPVAKYSNDKYLLGYFTDNELPWKNDALDRHLKYLAKDEPGYVAAKKWLDQRKGKDAGLEDITDEDRLEFTGFYFEEYARKVAAAIRKYDPNHMYLGCRFNQEREELQNPTIFKAAGKYFDVISINHYRKWEPVQSIMSDWLKWSDRPFIITEWYTKGEDSGLPNQTGAGWNVPTQQDRGYFYQNFVIELLKSKGCVGWHWFTYQDNDPLNLKTDPSNRDSNKGIVTSDYKPYEPLLNNMKQLNDHVFELIHYLDNYKPKKGGLAYEQNKKMGRGINVLDGDPRWINPGKARVTEEHFKLIKDAGFSNVRIVTHPFRSISDEKDFTLNETFFETLDWAIKQSLQNNLMVIVDFHEHSIMGKDPLGNKARFLACWEQIAAHCSNYPRGVLFEICNEPNMEAAIWNNLLFEAYRILRISNPKRTLIIGSRNANQIRFLQDLALPENDRNIIVAIHYYSPSQFTHQGASWSAKNKDISGIKWTGTMEEMSAITRDFDIASEWSEKNARPLTLGEFGAYEKADMESRARYTAFIARQAEERNWSWSYWEFNAGFGVFNPRERIWRKELLEALMPRK